MCNATPKPGTMACFAIKQIDTALSNGMTTTATTPTAPRGFGPSQLQAAYKLAATGGSGMTVAIIDAYNHPAAEADLAVYRSKFGLPACTTANGCFTKVNQNGNASPLPVNDDGWAGEISLDIDMVSAICPKCRILLVEATTPTMANLGAAVKTAVRLGAKFVSNSYGGGESGNENTFDTNYFNQPGVVITASTGDNGYGTAYPSTSKYVTAVGGTTLTTANNSRGWSETAWSDAGSGCARSVPKPAFQSSVNTACANRAVGDVSAVADPQTGVAVYQSYGGSGWSVFGGTSAAAPIIAATYALAGAPGSADRPNTYPYSHTANLFDITSGKNGSCSQAVQCKSGTGWDGPTGLGTPNGTAAFKSGPITPNLASSVAVTNSGNQTGTVGTAINLRIQATSSSQGVLTYGATGLPAGVSMAPSTGIISGTPTTAGTFNVTVTASTSDGASGTSAFVWTISPNCSGQKLGNPGFETGTPAPWSASAGVLDRSAYSAARTGSWKALLGGHGTTRTDTLAQTASITAGCRATLSFYLRIDSAETSTTTYDKLTVKAGTTTLATYSNVNKAAGYVMRSFDVSAFAGQNVAFSFTSVENSSRQSSFVIDDASLTLSR
jgi:subtilase family serine protease